MLRVCSSPIPGAASYKTTDGLLGWKRSGVCHPTPPGRCDDGEDTALLGVEGSLRDGAVIPLVCVDNCGVLLCRKSIGLESGFL